MIDALVLAHEGGWDELLYIVVPVAVIVLGVRWAERRARRQAEEAEGQEESTVEPPADKDHA